VKALPTSAPKEWFQGATAEKGRSFLCMSLSTSDNIVNQLNNQVLKVCRAVFERDPDQDNSDALNYHRYYIPGSSDAPPRDVMIRNNTLEPVDAGSWTVTKYQTNEVLASGTNTLEFIQVMNGMTEVQAVDWVREKGLIDPPHPPPQQPVERPKHDDDSGNDESDDGEKPGDDAERDESHFAEKLAEPDTPIIGTKENPFCKWKYRWFDQILIDPETEFRLGYVMARIANNETGECWPSQETLAAYVGKSVSYVKRGLKKYVARGHMRLVRQGGLKGNKRGSNHYQIVLKRNQEDVLKVFKARKDVALAADGLHS